MSTTTLSRRTILRGLLGGTAVSIALPPLEAMFNSTGTAYAQTRTMPKRFGVFFFGNGYGRVASRWVPTGTGTSWTPSPLLQPLAGIKEYVSVVSGMQTKSGQGHGPGTAAILSGAPAISQPQISQRAYTFSAPSIDQVVARAIGGGTAFRSLEVGASRRVDTREGTAVHYLSHNGPNSVNPPEYDPRAVFNRIFANFTPPSGGGGTPGPTTPDPTLAARRSVLDAVLSESAALRMRLGTTDRARLDQHLDGIRQLEQQIAALQTPPTTGSVSAACIRPSAPAAVGDSGTREPLEPIHRAMCDLITMALACGLTRVFSHMFSGPVGQTMYWQVGATTGQHGLSHDEPGDQPVLQKGVVFVMQQFAYLLEKLRSVPEGAGNLLDNCCILGTSDVSNGDAHDGHDFPILVAGRAGGALRSGVHYRSTSAENTSKVLFTMARAVGLPITEYGLGLGRVTDGVPALMP